jgi:hypothetical protein
MQHAEPEFRCTFILDESRIDPEDDQELQRMHLSADAWMMEKLLRHADERWEEDIRSAEVRGVMASAPGIECAVSITLFVEQQRLETGVGKALSDREVRDNYFEEVGMVGLWPIKFKGDIYSISASVRPFSDGG